MTENNEELLNNYLDGVAIREQMDFLLAVNKVTDEMLLYIADNYPARYMRFVTKEMLVKYT